MKIEVGQPKKPVMILIDFDSNYLTREQFDGEYYLKANNIPMMLVKMISITVSPVEDT